MRQLLLALAMSACLAPAAAAAVPSPSQSTTSPLLTLGASDGVAPDPTLGFVVFVRDLANNPIVGAMVVVDFANCPDVELGTLTGPNTIVDCVGRTARTFTGTGGRAELRLTGAIGTRSPASIGARARVYGDGVLLTTVPVAVLDQDGAEGVDAKDVALFLHDFEVAVSGGPTAARSDLDGDGAIGPADLGLLYRAAGDPAHEVSPARCDGGATERPTTPGGTRELTWRECLDDDGQLLQTFACNTNVGTRVLVVAAELAQPSTDLIGFEADIELFSPTVSTLPVYWQPPPSGCSVERFHVALGATSSCITPFAGVGNAAVTRFTPDLDGDPRRAMVRVVGASPEPVASGPGSRTGLFELTVHAQRSVGTGACEGCATPVALIVRSLRLVRGAAGSGAISAPDLELVASSAHNAAFWQAVVGVVPTQRASWGRIKTAYR